jgi:hypothetical protein
MPESVKITLVREYCGGLGKQFAGVVCGFYIQLTGLCKLLEEEIFASIFSKGRCKPHDAVESAVKRNLKIYEDKIESSNFESDVKSLSSIVNNNLKERRLKTGFDLPTLLSYINKTAYIEVLQFCIKDGFLVRKQCGNCISLSVMRPYICLNEGSLIEGTINNYYQKERKINDKGCELFKKKNIFVDKEKSLGDKKLDFFETVVDENTESEVERRLYLNDIMKLLKNRIAESKSENSKKIFKRHYAIIVNLYHYLAYGYSIQKAKQMIAEKIDKNVKTIDRDLKEIREYLPECFSNK